MLTPKNHDKLQVISGIVQDGLGKLEEEDIPYYDPRAEKIAAHAIKTCMPELASMAGERILVEALQGVSIDGNDSAGHDHVRVHGVLQRVSIQRIVEQAYIEGTEFSTSRHDLCAVFTPRYVDPDPSDIVFGQELYVPFGTITEFERAS